MNKDTESVTNVSVLLHLELEVLVVLEGVPGAAPGEAMPEEEAVAEVARLYFITERARAVGIGLSVGGLYVQ